MPYFNADIQRAARQLGTPIVRIALTHTHSDHIGALDALHSALPDAEVFLQPGKRELWTVIALSMPGKRSAKEGQFSEGDQPPIAPSYLAIRLDLWKS